MNPSSFSLRSLATSTLQFLLRVMMFRIRLLPTVIFFSVLLLGVKINDVKHKFDSGVTFEMNQAVAAEPAPSAGPSAETAPAKDTSKSDAGKANTNDTSKMSPEEYSLMQDMNQNKGAEKASSGETTARQEEVLKALESKVGEQVKQLNKAKEDLDKLVKSVDEEENANTKRLVKMAEGMKPDQAARVLEGVEFKILLEIMEGMSEKKASAILSAMPPEKASYLMTALAKRKKLFVKEAPEKSVMTN